MAEFLKYTGISVFLIIALYCGYLWIREIFRYAFAPDPDEKIKGAKLSAKYLSISVLAVIATIEIYKPIMVCIPFSFFFIALIWLNYFVYKKTTLFLKKN